MTRRIHYQRRERGKRKISLAARRRMGEAGRKNLQGWRARARERASELSAEVSSYKAALLHDLGPNPSASKLGLIEAAVTTFAGIVKVRSVVINSPKADVPQLTERASWLGSNLLRILKALNLDARPRPRILADVLPSKVAPTTTLSAANPPISA